MTGLHAEQAGQDKGLDVEEERKINTQDYLQGRVVKRQKWLLVWFLLKYSNTLPMSEVFVACIV